MNADPLDSDQGAALYNAALLDKIAGLAPEKRLENPDTSGRDISPVCGSDVMIELKLTPGGRIADVGYRIEACALTKTVLAVFLKTAPGLALTDIKAGHKQFAAWLNGATPLDARWRDLDILAPARTYTARHNSMLLPFTAALKAFDRSSGQ